MDYPQDWLSAADRGSISSEVCRRYRAYKAFQAAGGDPDSFADKYADDHGFSFVAVRQWLDLGGWWKGKRRGVALELRFTDAGVEWRAIRKRKALTGTAASVVAALQDIGAELSRKLYVDHQKAKDEEAA